MQLPSTYYDVIIKRDPELAHFTRKDIAELKQKGPFASVDDFSKYFEIYLSNTIKSYHEYIVGQLNDIGISSPQEIEEHLYQASNSAEFKKLLYSRHSDYLILVNFELFHKKTFYVNHNLIDNLSQTSLDVPSDFLRLPFETCLFIYDSRVAIEHFYAFQKEAINIDFSTPLSIFAYSLPAPEGNRKILFACCHANRNHSYSFVKRELLIREGWNIEEALQTDWQDILSDREIEENKASHSPNNSDDKVFYEDGLTFFRILVNTILYISSSNPRLKERASQYPVLKEKINSSKNKSKRRKTSNKLNKTSQLNFTEVGSGTQPIVVGNQKNNKNLTESKKHISIKGKRFVVRGHWRHQPYGENLTERKLIWIKPYYKGPEMADLTNKPYYVK